MRLQHAQASNHAGHLAFQWTSSGNCTVLNWLMNACQCLRMQFNDLMAVSFSSHTINSPVLPPRCLAQMCAQLHHRAQATTCWETRHGSPKPLAKGTLLYNAWHWNKQAKGASSHSMMRRCYDMIKGSSNLPRWPSWAARMGVAYILL
jgi:hypothetical protein